MPDDEREAGHPRLVKADRHDELADAFSSGAVVAVPSVGGYALAVKAGLPAAETRLNELVTDPDGPHYQVAHGPALRALTSAWTDELQELVDRCWPGPLELFLPRAASEETAEADPTEESGGWAIVVGTPEGRALRRLCKEQGPWRTAPLTYHDAEAVARSFSSGDIALVVDGGERAGEPATLVDATATPLRVLREGALPASFVEGAALMGARRRRLFRRRNKVKGGRGA